MQALMSHIGDNMNSCVVDDKLCTNDAMQGSNQNHTTKNYQT